MRKNHFSNNYSQSVSRWFLTIFIILSLIFSLTLLPLFLYLKHTFSSLQQEKIVQSLYSVSSQLESTVNGTLNASRVLSHDTRFTPFHYYKSDHTAISINTFSQLRISFHGLIQSLDLVSDASLQFYHESNTVITKTAVFTGKTICYYPDFFCVDELSYTEWKQLLSEYKNEFLPAQHVRTLTKEYDALIYNTTWSDNAFFYVCINIADLKHLLISDADQTGYYMTISAQNGELLYTDLPENATDYQTLSDRISTGNLNISIHIDNTVFYQKMQPLYLYMAVYGSALIAGMLIITLTGTHFTTKPVLSILQTLEHSHNIPAFDAQKNIVPSNNRPFHQNGFDYISERIRKADENLGEYYSILDNQRQILQARFMEKALNGQLISAKDIAQFHSYFPTFPDSYCLLLLQLYTYAEDSSTLYTEPLQLLSAFCKTSLPHAYQQQFSDTELLLLISETDFEDYRQILDFMIENINQEEPSYFARCIASRIFHHLESLPAAYRQLRDMSELSFPDEHTRVCTAVDCPEISNPAFTMTDLMTLYTAITYGNRKMAMNKLHAYSEESNKSPTSSSSRRMFEMICTILTYIKLEHPSQLIDLHIPAYRADENIYAQLEELTGAFCDKLTDNSRTDVSPFAKELVQYIDENYTDSDLCLTSLETHFKCSSSTIRKTFKNATDMTVTSYIEQKRMTHANELLIQKKKTIAEIALECGFSNTNSFYKAYRRVYGHAPTMLE